MLKTVQLGRNSGLRVSRLCLGTMNFGEPGRGHQGDWTLGADDARPIFKAAIDRGLFYFDCADVYGVGASERVVGQLLRELLRRDEYVLATKISMPMGRGANQAGLSRKHVIEGVNACLERLGLDYIDHLVIHRHPHGVPGHVEVPIEESIEALHDVVKAGKVLYLGGSSMFAWQFAELQMTARMNGWTQFVSMQNHYNLVYREEEREMNPYCVKSGVALMPWSPLARGILTGAYKGGFQAGSTARSQGADRVRTQSLYRGDAVFKIADRVVEIANKYDKGPAQIALAWLLSKPGITSPVVGVSKLEQLDQLVEATEIVLDPGDIAYLEELYRPVDNLLSLGASLDESAPEADVAERVAIITVHGVADQQPGQTVGELARLLCHGGTDRSRYIEGEKHEILLPVVRLLSIDEVRAPPDAEPQRAPDAEPVLRVQPGRPSNFYLAHRRVERERDVPATEDLGVTLTDYLLSRYQPDERDALYESTRISLLRKKDALPVDLYELYWADYSRLKPGGVRALSASYQLFFHLSTLARDVVDQVALATEGGRALRVLQWLHAWSAWLLKGPAALLQLMMLLLVGFGAAAFVPEEQMMFALALVSGLAALAFGAFSPVVWVRRDGVAARLRAVVPWMLGSLICAGISVAAAVRYDYGMEIYFCAAGLLAVVTGAMLLKRYSETVRGVRLVGLAGLLALVVLLAIAAVSTREGMSGPYEWMLTAALNTGEYLLAALLSVWALLALVQVAALLLGFALASKGEPAVAASLATARMGMVVSTALFTLLSLVLWSVIAYVAGLTLVDFAFMPVLFVRGYGSAANFFDSQVADVGTLFTPLMGLVGVIGAMALIALAPSLREELSPGVDAQSASWTSRLGKWWTGGRRALGYIFGGLVPLLAIIGALVYLLFIEQKLFGIENALNWFGDSHGEVLVKVGQWLAGGAVTITALGARFTETFGKLRVALDAALDVDNYFHDPANRLPPRARIFSRYASLLAEICKRGYTRVVIVSHSQGTVISADLLRYLGVTRRLDELTGPTPLSLVTVGSPLRDLYAAMFPFLYRWMGPQPVSFADSLPEPGEVGVERWVNAYRAGDYVGRSIWTSPDETAMFRVATVSGDGEVLASNIGNRTEFCLGAGAHTHYFNNDAIALAVSIDALVGGEQPKKE